VKSIILKNLTASLLNTVIDEFSLFKNSDLCNTSVNDDYITMFDV